MADFDRGFKEVARTAGPHLARLAGIECERWEPIVSELQLAERLADRAFRARRGRERFVVYFEAYTRWDRHAPWNLLAKAGLLSERERMPTRVVLFILQRRGYRSQNGQFRLELNGEPTQQLWFREVPFWEQEPRPWWEDVPALMPLYPLCRHGRQPRQAIEYAVSVIRERATIRSEQADELFLLSIFGSLAYRRMDVETIIGRESMLESRICREMRDLGRLEARREDVSTALEVRFGPETARGFSEAINAIEDRNQLNELFRLAILCAGPDEFRRGFSRRIARR